MTLTELLADYKAAVYSGAAGAPKANCCVWCDAEIAAGDAIIQHVSTLEAKVTELSAALERSIQLCAECGKGFVDDDWAMERRVLEAKVAELEARECNGQDHSWRKNDTLHR